MMGGKLRGRKLNPLIYSVVDRSQPGGVQTVLEQLAQRLRARGTSVIELEPGPPATKNGKACPLFVREGRRRDHLPSLLRLARLLARHRPTVVNIHFVSSEALCFFALRKTFGYRIVLSAHGSDILEPDPHSGPLLPELLTRADAVTVVSDGIRRKVLEYGAAPDRVHLVPNGVDCEFWSPAEAPVAPSTSLVAAGRLDPIKGFDVLLDAMALLADRLPEARLAIIGGGPAESDLRRRAANLGLDDRVEFPGFVEAAALRERFRGADLFVLSSRSEGMPLTLLEAMASGLPTVATCVGGVPEIVAAETGAIVPPDCPERLGDEIARFLADQPRREAAARAARRRAENFSSHAAQDAYIAVLERAATA